MSFVLLDDKFHSNPKTLAAGLEGAGLYARALSYCGDHLTDGFVPLPWAKEIARAAIRKKVTDAGFWVEVAGGETYSYSSGDEFYSVVIVSAGYFIPDYLAYNPTSKSVIDSRDEKRRKRSEAGKKGAAVRWQRDSSVDGKAMANGMANAMANGWQTDGPLPLPLPLNSPKAVTSYAANGPGENLKEAS